METRAVSWRWGWLSVVGFGALVAVILLVVRVTNSIGQGSSMQAWIWGSTAIALLLVGVFGFVRHGIELRKGQQLVSRLQSEHSDAAFGILRFGALRSQLAEAHADLSGWDWMMLAAITTGPNGVIVWGGRAHNLKTMAAFPWERIGKAESVQVGVRAHVRRGIRLSIGNPGERPISVDLVPVATKGGNLTPLGDDEFQAILEHIQKHAMTQQR